jgi:transcription initiation factor TFIID subunit 6
VLDRDVSDFLYNDLETKLLEVLQEAKKIMRHSKRSVLSTQDVNAAFKKLNIQETYGYPSSVPFNYEKLSHDNPNLWLTRSQNIDLKSFVIQPKFDQATLDLAYSMHLTALDGVQPDIAENVRETGFEFQREFD